MIERLFSFLGFGARPESRDSPRITEAALLDRLRPAAIDWSRSVDDLRREFGVAPCGKNSQAVYLPPTTALTPFPLRFYVRIPGTVDHCPPQSYCADVDVHGIAQANFSAVREPLDDLLGGSTDDSASNTLGRKWTLGTLTVRACVWPRRLNDSDTRVDAFVTLASSVPHAPPDESLRNVPTLTPDCLLDAPALPPGWGWNLTISNFTTRRNPPGVFDTLADGAPLIWRDPAHDRFGITGHDVSFVFARSDVSRLEVRDEPPDRSPWCSRGIDVVLRRMDGSISRVPLGDAGCHMNDWSQADPSRLTDRLAEFWGLPPAMIAR